MPNFRWVQLETSSSSLFCLSPPLIAVSNPFAQSYGAVGGDFNELIPSHVANGVFDGEHPTPAWQADGIKLTGWIDRLVGSLFNAYLLPHFLTSAFTARYLRGPHSCPIGRAEHLLIRSIKDFAAPTWQEQGGPSLLSLCCGCW